MPKQIWLAPILSNNRQRLIERLAEVLDGHGAGSILYLAASRPLLDVVTAALLDGEHIRGVWGTLPIFLFRGFARHLLATAIDDETDLPLSPRIPIDRDELPLKRSLISRVMLRLLNEGKLRALGPLAHREGCVNTVARLIGEIQRAAKSPAEFASIVEARARDFHPGGETASAIPRQIDFDREIALIYAGYQAALDRSQLTEDDADQLRALDGLRGELDIRTVRLPWLQEVKLLVLDGFFDFTPAQGEMLRLLIPSIPNVIVNLNRDERNAEIFRPFDATIDQLNSIANFETLVETGVSAVAGSLRPLRERLFSSLPMEGAPESLESPGAGESNVTLLECSDRQTEIRAIAKRIKRLVHLESYELSEIALVVRELASYTEVIARVFGEEFVPCSLDQRTKLSDVPAARAALKLFELLMKLAREGDATLKASELAGLVKSGYFRLSEAELRPLREQFSRDYPHLLDVDGFRRGPFETNVGQWDADELENVIAFVGAELRVDNWLRRAQKLTAQVRDPAAEEHLAPDLEDEPDPDEATSAPGGETAIVQKRRAEWVEAVDIPLPGSERRPKPARELHPALIAWSALVVGRFAQLITEHSRGSTAANELRDAVMRLLDQLQFADEVGGLRNLGAQASRLPLPTPSWQAGCLRSQAADELSDRQLPALTLDLRGLEGLRRALSAAARSIISTEGPASPDDAPLKVTLAAFLEETMRCARAQSLVTSSPDAGGLKVLEVTDVRGLRFRAVFIAGLVEGGFPLRTSRDWMYPHEEREQLKQYGLTLEDISPNTLLKEEHYFYQASCRATERLYLSRPAVLEDGSETVASYYIEELTRAVGVERVRKETARRDFDGRTLFESSRESELATLLIRQEERLRHTAQRRGNYPRAMIERLISEASESGLISEPARRRIAIERERGGLSFGNFDGVVGDASLIATLRKHYGAGHVFSASELSLYGRCPFKFFAEKVLKLEPRGEAALDLTALDAGSLLHETLRRFFERHRGKRLAECDRADLRRELRDVADQVFDEHQRTVPPLNPQVWQIDREIRKLLLEQVLDYELTIQEQTAAKDVRPTYFELAFGMPGVDADPGSTAKRLELRRLSDDQAVELRGQIDRVDVARDGTATAYDYKLSKGAGLDDMTEGRALQLHIYLAALEQLFLRESQIAGGGYYTMKGVQPRRNAGLYRAAFREYTAIGKTTASTLPDPEWEKVRAQMQSRIFEFVDGIREGRFEVNPSAPDKSCPHCDYSAVCRYERFRIQRKQDGERGGATELKN
ncbi:MAG TPA: PD-(D/E)XK nuclease family protein [Blastocatellia bacterium]|nr:PD-(D/E)XK nuclease family protein [Blastocatellia bacterium]